MRIAALLALALAAVVAVQAWLVPGTSAPAGPAPSSDLDPVEVVELQLAALQRDADEGIRTAFRFASPGNRTVTGPLDRFARMVRNEAYAPLLGHARADVGRVHQAGTQAAIPVIVRDQEGREHGFMFILSRQGGEECHGCWMTDSVVPHPVPKPAGQLI